MLNYDPVTHEFFNDIYTVRKCGPKWYLIKMEYIGYSRKYHKSVYGNRIIGTFDHYEPARRAQSYLMTGNITTSTNDSWSTTYTTHFETQTTYNLYSASQTFPVATTMVPRVLPVAPVEVTIG